MQRHTTLININALVVLNVSCICCELLHRHAHVGGKTLLLYLEQVGDESEAVTVLNFHGFFSCLLHSTTRRISWREREWIKTSV